MAGVPPTLPPPPDLIAAQRITKRQLQLMLVGLTAALIVAIVLGAPLTLLGGFGFAYAFLGAVYAQARNRPGKR